MKINAERCHLDRLIKNIDLIEKYMLHTMPDEGNDVSEDSLNAHLFLLNRVRDALDSWAMCAEFEDWAPKLKKGDVDEITGLTYDPKLTVIK
jgi:hypothetical protein